MSKEVRNKIIKIFKLRNSKKKNNHLNCSLRTNQKGFTELITVQWSRSIKPKTQDNWRYYQGENLEKFKKRPCKAKKPE